MADARASSWPMTEVTSLSTRAPTSTRTIAAMKLTAPMATAVMRRRVIPRDLAAAHANEAAA